MLGGVGSPGPIFRKRSRRSSMQRTTAVVLLFVLLALVGAAGLWWSSLEEAPIQTPTADATEEAPAPEEPRPDAMTAEVDQAGGAGDGTQAIADREAVMATAPEQTTAPKGPPVQLTGRLVHEGNAAAANVELVFRAFQQWQGTVPMPGPLEDFLPGGRRALPKDAPRTKTDAEGRFTIAVPGETGGRLELTDDALLFEREETGRVSPAREPVDLGVLGLIPAAEVAGIVKDERGVRLAGIRVSLARQVEGPFGLMMVPGHLQTKSDDEGRFALRGARPGSYELRTQSSKHVPGRLAVSLEKGEKEHGIEVELASGAAVAGRVVDDLGRPLEGMRVHAQRMRSMGPVVIDGFGGGEAAVTDAQGAFTIGGLTDERVTLRVTGKGHAPAVRNDVPVGAGDVLLEMSRNGGVRGRVVDGAGNGVAGSQVSARPVERGEMFWGGQTTKTAEDGSFLLDDITPGRKILTASGEQHLEAESLPVDVRAGKVEQDVRITVQRGAMLEVLVTDGNGEPVPEANVEVREPSEGAGSMDALGNGRQVVRRTVRASAGGAPRFLDGSAELLGSGKTDAQGRATIGGLRAGAAVVTATHRELVGKERRHVALPAVGKADAALTMVRGGHVDVRVLGPDGRPAADETILVEFVGSDAEPIRARSGADGLARIGPLAPGGYQALLALEPKPQNAGGFMILAFGNGPRRIESTRTSLRIDEGEVATLQLRKPLLAKVTGTVVDAAGVVAGAEVSLQGEGEMRIPGLSSPNSARTDASGRFELNDLPAGAYTLTWSRKDALVPGEEKIELAEGQQLSRSLAIPGGILAVTVHSAEGEPLRNAQVSVDRTRKGDDQAPRQIMMFSAVSASSDDNETTSMQLGGPTSARTDEDGRAVLRDLPAGEYRVTIRHRTHVTKGIGEVQIPDPGQKDLGTIKLEQGASIRGSVVDGTGQPVQFAMVVLKDENGSEQRTMAQNGAFRFDSLKPGKYRLRMERLGPDRTEPAPQETEVEVLPGKPTPVRLVQ